VAACTASGTAPDSDASCRKDRRRENERRGQVGPVQLRSDTSPLCLLHFSDLRAGTLDRAVRGRMELGDHLRVRDV